MEKNGTRRYRVYDNGKLKEKGDKILIMWTKNVLCKCPENVDNRCIRTNRESKRTKYTILI